MNKPEVIVLGAGMGGLSTAAEAALSGFDVLVLEGTDSIGGKAKRIKSNGFTFDPGPSIIILKEIYEDLFQRAGRDINNYVSFLPLDPISRVFLEGEGVFDIPATIEGCTELIKAISIEDADQFQKLMAKLEKAAPYVDRGIFSKTIAKPFDLLNSDLLKFSLLLDVRTPYKNYIDSLFKTSFLRSFFYGFPSYSGCTYLHPNPGAAFIPFFMLNEGVYYPENGVASIPEAIYQLCLELGVKFEMNSKVAHVTSKNREVNSLVLENGTVYQTQNLIVATDRIEFEKLLGRNQPTKPGLSYYTIQWGLTKPIEGLDVHNLLVPKSFEEGFEETYREETFPGEPIVYLNNPSAVDSSLAPAGSQCLFAVVTTPANNGKIDWKNEEANFEKRVLGVMEKFGFNVDSDSISTSITQTPLTFQERDGNFLGSLYGADELSRGLLNLPLPNSDGELKNVAYAGGSVQPGAGLPMTCLSGKLAVRVLNKNLKRRF